MMARREDIENHMNEFTE